MFLPSTCTIAVFEGSGQPLTLREIPLPTPGIGQWLVRNEYTTLCASDLHTFNGKRQERTPTILGHEITGQLVAAGPGAPTTDANGAPLLPGTKVTWAIYASDPGSELALRGIPQKGDQLFKYGHELLTETHTLHGGLSEYTLLRQHTPIIALPNDLPATVAALVNCSVATTCGAFRLAGALTSRSILITGGGMLGLVACALANENGAVNITVADNQPSRLATSLKFGAKEATTLQQVEGKFDVVMDFTGVPEVMEQSLHKLAIGGTAIWVGAAMPGTPVPIRAEQVVRNLWTIKGLHNYNATDLQAAVSFMTNNWQRYPFGELVHGGYNLSQTNEAFDYATKHHPYRVGIKTDRI